MNVKSGAALLVSRAHMELIPKSTKSIIEVNLSLKLNYNKLPHLLLNSNCGHWKTVYIYKKNIGGGNRSPKTPSNSCYLTLTHPSRLDFVPMFSINIQRATEKINY